MKNKQSKTLKRTFARREQDESLRPRRVFGVGLGVPAGAAANRAALFWRAIRGGGLGCFYQFWFFRCLLFCCFSVGLKTSHVSTSRAHGLVASHAILSCLWLESLRASRLSLPRHSTAPSPSTSRSLSLRSVCMLGALACFHRKSLRALLTA